MPQAPVWIRWVLPIDGNAQGDRWRLMGSGWAWRSMEVGRGVCGQARSSCMIPYWRRHCPASRRTTERYVERPIWSISGAWEINELWTTYRTWCPLCPLAPSCNAPGYRRRASPPSPWKRWPPPATSTSHPSCLPTAPSYQGTPFWCYLRSSHPQWWKPFRRRPTGSMVSAPMISSWDSH